MTSKELTDIQNSITSFLKERRLRDALDTLQGAARAEMLFDLSDKIKQSEQTYAYMLKYLTDGVNDPDRDKILEQLISDAYSLLNQLTADVLSRESPTLYYNTVRYLKRQGEATKLSSVISKWKDAQRQLTSLSSLFTDASQKNLSRRINFNSIETELFNAIWASYPLNKQDALTIVDIICSSDTPISSTLRFVSALGLAAMEFADNEVIAALCDIYTTLSENRDLKSRKVTSAALVWLLSALYKYSERPFSSHLKLRLEALRDVKTWARDVRLAFMELVRAHDTERINKAMRDEIIPGIMALRPEIEKKIRDFEVDIDEEDALGDNPEWEEILSNSELGDKLKELNDLHMEGSDIYMGTFSHLKSFPFFNEVVNWFTPMTKDSFQVEKMLDENLENESLISLVENLPFICDSDKYSMLFSLDMIQNKQSERMLDQIKAQAGQMDEMFPTIDGLTDSDIRKADIRNFVQNLYRFVNLFRRKGEFYNIFFREINLLKVESLREVLENVDLLKLVGEFYFRHKYYRESLTAFRALDNIGEFDATLYQKMGYALQKNGDDFSAAKYYEQADLLDGNSRWLKIRLVSVYRNLGELDKAKALLAEMNDKYPDDFQITMLSGYTYLQEENYREALKHFYKAEFLAPDNKQTLRPIAWLLFMIGEFEKARKYYDIILLDKPTSEDYLNMGHVALAKSEFKEAINFYKMYILNEDNDKERFFKALDSDKKLMHRVGINKNVITLIADAMLYELNS